MMFSNKISKKYWIFICKKINFNACTAAAIKINSKYIVDLRIKVKSRKHLGQIEKIFVFLNWANIS